MLKVSRIGPVTRFDMARTLAGRGYYWTTAYLLDGIMVDSGCAHTASELGAALGEDLPARILVTHSHEDHIGANSLLQRRHAGLEILAHPLAVPVMADPWRAQPLQLYRQVFWGWPAPSRAQSVVNDAIIRSEKYSLRVIFTPGHSPDHLCFFEPERGWLFSGDLFVGGRERALRSDGDIWQIIASLKSVAALPITRLFPGCARVRDNPNEELQSKIHYLEEVGGRVQELHRKGWRPEAIARAQFGGTLPIELLTFGHFSRRHLVTSFLKGV